MELNFTNIYNKYQTKVLGLINHKTYNKDRDVAEELCQDVFMKIFKNLDKFDSEKSKLSTWIYNITNNAVIDYARKKKLITISIQSQIDDNEREVMQVISDDDIHGKVIQKELNDKIVNSIMSLPETYRRLSELFFLKELSHEEISQELNLPIGSVKGQIYRAKAILQKDLS